MYFQLVSKMSFSSRLGSSSLVDLKVVSPARAEKGILAPPATLFEQAGKLQDSPSNS
jgi:hypothetical protein